MYFYDKELYILKKIVIENEIGQIIEEYVKGDLFMGDIQPINAYDKTTSWGSDVISEKQLFTDHISQVGEMVIYKNKAYEIEKAIYWDDYNIYALKGSDIIVN